MIPAIVLSSHTIGLGVIRALGIMGVPIKVVYYEKKDMGYVSKYVQEKIYAPHPEKNEDQFIRLLIKIADHLGHGLLIPADDATLNVVSRNKKLLESYYIVACVESEIVEKLINKKYTYELAEKMDIPAPKTFVPRSVNDCEKYSHTIEYPCLVKPCYSHRYFELFRTKMVRVNNFDQMLAEYKKAADAGLEVMLQEFVPGDDTQGVNYNSYFWDGEPLIEFTAEKVRLSPPEFGIPRVVISKSIPEIIEPGRKILKAMGYYGYSCTEFKKDSRDGVYKLMEVNGRHNRSGLLAVRCGINFPWIEYNHRTANDFHTPPYSAIQGIYWIDEFKDVINNFQYMTKERYSLTQYIRPYLNSHIFATFDLKDLKPFMKRCSTLIAITMEKIFSFSRRNHIEKGERT